MKVSLSTILLLSSSFSGLTQQVLGNDDTTARRRLRNPHQHDGEIVHNDKDSRASPRAADGDVTHLSMGNKGNKAPPVHSSDNQDYDMHIVGGSQSAAGEFPYYGEFLCWLFERKRLMKGYQW
jgi:hypothetical protein